MHVAAVVAFVILLLVGVRVDALFFGLLEDHGIEPFAQRHAGAARGFACGLAGLGPYPFHAPRHAEFHCSHHVQSGDANADRLAAEPARVNGRWVQTRGRWSRRPTFAVHGKQRVKIGRKCRIFPALSGFAV
jgi:hypothetical protein